MVEWFREQNIAVLNKFFVYSLQNSCNQAKTKYCIVSSHQGVSGVVGLSESWLLIVYIVGAHSSLY